MSHDATTANPEPTEEPIIDPAVRRMINARLGKTKRTRRLCCAVAFAPVSDRHEPVQPRVVLVKVPRGSAGKPPRGGVFIPLPAAVLAKRLKPVGKHARNHARFKDGWERARKPTPEEISARNRAFAAANPLPKRA